MKLAPRLASGLVGIRREILVVVSFAGTYASAGFLTERYGPGLAFQLFAGSWFAFFLSALPMQLCCSVFYGKRVTDKYDGQWAARSLKIPPPQEFYSAMTSDVGVTRRALGYLYAVLQPTNSIALGVGLAILLRGIFRNELNRPGF